MKRFFTSDQHFGHKNVIQFCKRPFKSIDEMHAELIRRHNAVVGPEDLVYHLGDFSFNKKWAKLIVPQLNGTNVLILGNHDEAHPVKCGTQEKLWKMKNFYLDAGFLGVSVDETLYIHGKKVEACHLPYTKHDKRDYDVYRLKDEGRWLFHGHVHNSWKIRGHQINVGVDAWDYYPVALEQLVELMNANKITNYYRNLCYRIRFRLNLL